MKKYTSRKFIVSLLSIISGMAGMIASDNSWFMLVVDVILIVVPAVTYIVAEGKVDKAAILKTIDDIRDEVESAPID